MLIIFIELGIIFWITRILKSKGLTRIHKYVCLAFCIQVFILTIYRLELRALGREVYYSDAEVYWNATVALLQGWDVTTWNMGYVYYSYLIQITSPFVWVGFINISNILLIDITSLIFAYVMIGNNVHISNIRWFFIMSTFNPLVIYSLTRNLKDILFLFYTSIIILCFHWLNCQDKRRISLYAFVVSLTLLVTDVRPWGFLVTLSLFFYFYSISLARSFQKNPIWFFVSFLGIAVVCIAVLYLMRYLGYVATLELWVPIVLESAFGYGILDLLLAPFRILTGPGPVRSLQGARYFWYYTVSGNIFSAIGALLWWLCLGSMGARLITGRAKGNSASIMFAIVWVLFMLIYSLQYGGSLELRFRGTIYILTLAFVMSIVDYRVSRSTRILTVIMTGIVFIGGLVFG